MTSINSDNAPKLFDGRPILELVVPVELTRGYRRGLAMAARLAQRWQVPVRIVHVRTPDEPEPEESIEEITDAFRGLHPDLLADGAEVPADDIAEGLGRLMSDQSLLLIASEHASQWLDSPSVAETIVEATERMMLLCGPHCEDPPVGTSVVVPLDGSPRAEQALGPALELAAATGSKLWVLTAVSMETAKIVAELKARGQEASESAYLRSVADRLVADGADVAWEVIHHDDPVEAVTTFVRDQGSSIVVASTHGETGVARRLFGSVCMGLVERASVPVLIVKPEPEEEPALTEGS